MPIVLRDRVFLRFVQVRIFFLDDFSRAHDRLIKQIAQRHIFPRARLHQLAVFAQDAPKWNVAKIRGTALAPRNLENLLEMQGLRRADDIPERIPLQLVDAIVDGGDVGRRVIEAAVAFPHDAGPLGQLGNVAEKNADRAFADFRDAGLEQPVHHRRQPIVVETFPALDVVVDVENFVDGFEFLLRERDAFIPDARDFPRRRPAA